MNYKEEVFKGMELLNQHPKTIFIGQAVEYKGTALTHQVKNFPKGKATGTASCRGISSRPRTGSRH